MQEIEVGDIVMVPCKVIGKAKMALSKENLLDCVLLGTHEKRIDYNRVPIKFTVFQDDIVKYYKQGKGEI